MSDRRDCCGRLCTGSGSIYAYRCGREPDGGRQISGNHGNDQERNSLGFERLNRTGKWQRHTASNNNTSY